MTKTNPEISIVCAPTPIYLKLLGKKVYNFYSKLNRGYPVQFRPTHKLKFRIALNQ